MSDKRILIVDDEESILAVLKSSLKKLGSRYEVFTAPSGQNAFVQLRQRKFDLVITDYKMAGMDGLEVLQAVRLLQPEARTILMTAYGNDAVEAETRRLEAYRYLTKPLEIDDFRQLVKEALNDLAISRPGILILSDERCNQISEILNRLHGEVGARCVALADGDGNCIARIGNTADFPFEEAVPLLSGSVAGLSEAGRVIDGKLDSINLAYRESEKQNLYVVNIGFHLLLIIVIDRSPYSCRLGSVWYMAQETALALSKKIGEDEYANPQEVFGDNLNQNMDDELDKLFVEPTPEQKTSVAQNPLEKKDGVSNPAKKPEKDPIPEQPPVLLSFEQAMKSGLISNDLSAKR